MPEVPREDAYNSVHRGPGGYQENSQTPRSMELENKTPAQGHAFRDGSYHKNVFNQGYGDTTVYWQADTLASTRAQTSLAGTR
ncbi:MAG: hypothetical protein KAV87_02055 [Desulfobacteraceae bacterium]|nr:hypothetical protein [Desulfobacteraceae bacterium]